MRTDIIDVEVAEDQVVACPNCGQRNRVQKQRSHVSFRCGACRTKLLNPFALGSRYAKTVASLAGSSGSLKRRVAVAIGLFAVLSLVVAIFMSLPSGTPTKSLPHFQQVQPVGPLVSLSPPRIQQVQPVEPVVALSPPRRLNNGQVIKELRIGRGTLTIDNGTARDAVIKIVNEQTGLSMVEFYIWSRQTASVEHIPDGDFCVIFASGWDWNSTVGTFTRDKSFAKFDSPFDFVTTSRPQGYEYSVFTLTLQPVVNGNVKMTDVGEEEFLKY